MVMNIYLLRIFAIFFIVNQHTAYFYPRGIYNFGGHLGNSIFFMISGIGLAISYKKKPLSCFLWYKKRYLKLIIPIIFFTLVTNIGDVNLFVDKLVYFIIPHKYAQLDQFLPNLVVLYFIFYFINKLNVQLLSSLFIFIMLFFLFFYIKIFGDYEVVKSDFISSSKFYWLSSFACFILGVLLGRQHDVLQRNYSEFKWMVFFFFLFLILIIFHFSVKIYFSKILFVNYFVNILAIFCLYASTLYLNKFSTFFLINKLIIEIAQVSLPVYIIHYNVISVLECSLSPSYSALLYVFIISFSLAYVANLFYKNIIEKYVLRFI